ncbi:MAG: hypothetical protein K2V38_16835 [Gemmataceae bacterium]|nr:hypothetical protein [Gemmataceae bacterium]
MIDVPQQNDCRITLATGEEVSLRFAVRSFQYLLHLQEHAQADFAALLAVTAGGAVGDGRLRSELTERGFAGTDGRLTADFRSVLAASVWEVEPGRAELVVPIQVLPPADPNQYDRWYREVERYENEMRLRYQNDEPDGPAPPPR